MGWTGSNGSSPEKSVTIYSGSTGDKTYTANCKGITKLIISEGTTYIGGGQYKGWDKLVSVTIPNSVTSIGQSAFDGCSSLQELTLPFVGGSETKNTFLGYIFGASEYSESPKYVPTSLKKVTITKATSIGDYAFCGCGSLTSITIGDSVTSIGSSAFRGCSSLISITIPNSVPSIGDSAFSSCSSLSKVYYKGGENEWKTIFIENSNYDLIKATIYYYSETKPSASGNYWHYVDGEIVEW